MFNLNPQLFKIRFHLNVIFRLGATPINELTEFINKSPQLCRISILYERIWEKLYITVAKSFQLDGALTSGLVSVFVTAISSGRGAMGNSGRERDGILRIRNIECLSQGPKRAICNVGRRMSW